MWSIFNRAPDEEKAETIGTKTFFDMVAPSTIRFQSDQFTLGDTYRCAWAVRDCPVETEQQALLSRIADRNGVTVRIYTNKVESSEHDRIVQQAVRKNKLDVNNSSDISGSVNAEGNLQNIVEMLSTMRRENEPLLYCAIFIEISARSLDELRARQSELAMELTRSKITVDRLMLRECEGFVSVMPLGKNCFGGRFERVYPASSVANLYPFNYSGKSDPHGFCIGRDKYGTNVIVDLDRRSDDVTNANVIILGNSGQGKSYTMKLLLTNLREAGKKVICLDAEAEYRELTENLGGCYIDLMSGRYMINPLEPKTWASSDDEDQSADTGRRRASRLSGHISYLKDFFRAAKEFTDAQLDTIEIMLGKLYAGFSITDYTDFSALTPESYPTMSDLCELVNHEYISYRNDGDQLYTKRTLQEICLGLYSMCKGAEAVFFDGHTNITDDMFICFGVKGLMDTNQRLKDAMLFNILSYMSNELLGRGNTAASIDELYLCEATRCRI